MSFLEFKFPVVPDDRKIRTKEFLEACDKVLLFFDILGSRFFTPVKSDIAGNIAKIRAKYKEQKEEEFETLNGIIDYELNNLQSQPQKKGQGIATNALMWLRRGLQFIASFLKHLVAEDYITEKNDRESLQNCAVLAYNESLQEYHGWIVQKVFTMAMKAAPYRHKLIMDLAGPGKQDDESSVIAVIVEFGINFEANIEVIKVLFTEKDVERAYKV